MPWCPILNVQPSENIVAIVWCNKKFTFLFHQCRFFRWQSSTSYVYWISYAVVLCKLTLMAPVDTCLDFRGSSSIVDAVDLSKFDCKILGDIRNYIDGCVKKYIWFVELKKCTCNTFITVMSGLTIQSLAVECHRIGAIAFINKGKSATYLMQQNFKYLLPNTAKIFAPDGIFQIRLQKIWDYFWLVD